MSNFLLTFHGGAPGATDEERDASMSRWGAWFAQIGDAVVDAGDGVEPAAYIGKDGNVMKGEPQGTDAANAVTGYTVINAEDVDAAVEIAKTCPILQDGGTVEIGQILGLMVESVEVETFAQVG
jgi:hypothetical protein